MGRLILVGIVLGALSPLAHSYVEAPYSLGQTVNESTNVLLVEVTRVNKEKNLIIYKKLRDIKGKHEGAEIKHNIGMRGFHEREWKTVMKWAEVGKKAIIFHNGGASETCLGDYWYQCAAEGEWWAMSHAEPFLLRTFCGEVPALAEAVGQMLQGKEVIVTCMADINKEQLHERKGKMQMMKASLKRENYNARRDFLGFGTDPADIQEIKTIILLAESTGGWKFLPEPVALEKKLGERWIEPGFDDKEWRKGQAPIGYGEEEIGKRKGTTVKEEGVSFLFRREFEAPADLFKQKGVVFRLSVASDDSAKVWINGKLADADPVDDHEFAYWNREVEIDAGLLRPGRNVVSALVKNHVGSSDIYLDMEIAADVPLPKKKK